MGIWNIHKWNVLPEKMNEHEEIMTQLFKLWKRLMPHIQVHYFRQRFGPMNGRVLVASSFESLAAWEDTFIKPVRTNPEARKLSTQWIACWDQSSHDECFWDEAWVDTEMTNLMAK
jgi:hypothetical protein